MLIQEQRLCMWLHVPAQSDAIQREAHEVPESEPIRVGTWKEKRERCMSLAQTYEGDSNANRSCTLRAISFFPLLVTKQRQETRSRSMCVSGNKTNRLFSVRQPLRCSFWNSVSDKGNWQVRMDHQIHQQSMLPLPHTNRQSPPSSFFSYPNGWRGLRRTPFSSDSPWFASCWIEIPNCAAKKPIEVAPSTHSHVLVHQRKVK